jgi:hypothetical protein
MSGWIIVELESDGGTIITTLAFAGKEGLILGRPHACICVSLCTRDGPYHLPLPDAPEQALSTRHNVPADGQCSSIQGSTMSQSSCITYTSPPRRRAQSVKFASAPTPTSLRRWSLMEQCPRLLTSMGNVFRLLSFCSLYFPTKSLPAAL